MPAGWIYEPKLDGVRCIAAVRADGARLLSRTGKRLDARYPELVDALCRAARGSSVLDGEIVAIDRSRGVSSFAPLQRRRRFGGADASAAGVAMELWLFDCLWFEGLDLRRRPLLERKSILQDAVRGVGPIRLTPTLDGPFERLFRAACRRGGEGLIAKRADSAYASGRSGDWVKLKCVREQEFVIGGWTDPRGSREAPGALLVGYYDEPGRLRYAGTVGPGYDRATRRRLLAALEPLARRRSPFVAEDTPRAAGVHWTAPRLVAQVAFAEWTSNGRLRHPRLVGLREDTPAREVRREEPGRPG